MDYDFRNRPGPPYDSQIPMYRQSSSSSSAPSHPLYGPPSSTSSSSSAMYPRIGQSSAHTSVPPVGRPFPHHQTTSPSPSSGVGIRVAIKPEYRITPPPQLLPQIGDIPHSNFQYDFDFERKVIAEAEKENQNWSRLGLENLPARTTSSASSVGTSVDPVVSKYIASGLNREAVPLAVAHYGDNPTKVRSFVNGYTLLREMGFSSNSVAEALVMYDNDTDKALAHFLNSSS
ncbi:uncharacterized protein LOC107414532 [Ziziphus jujuba]|uniref:Uncharacterized protein LOC107414532 n=2 Tax=Ziziphus jujuba TaxID=326968 RepID=A0A6P3ZRV2_ZIZJJ|nr:uncharacterized protein LOC107414532 [Ziziphus jujuba]KAH7538148.1 hypothetical protein FEM48_Zijuj03G0168300 [Ziziphus jujuba var. spinosa]